MQHTHKHVTCTESVCVDPFLALVIGQHTGDDFCTRQSLLHVMGLV